MKKAIVIPLTIILFTLIVASLAMAETEVIPSYAEQIMETWGASSAEELRFNIATFFQNEMGGDSNFGPDAWQNQVKICFDKTTEELIADPQSWNLAIASSKEIDLKKLADKGLIGVREHVPTNPLALHQWLLPKKVQNMLPIHPSPYLIYRIYCYYYNAETEEAVFLVCKNEDDGPNSLSPDTGGFAEEMLSQRSVADIRFIDGLVNAKYQTHEDLMENPQDWDTALLCDRQYNQIDMLEQLDILEHTGLLYDFSQDEYWQKRDMDWPYSNSVVSSSGKMIAIPIWPMGDRIRVIVINAQSTVIPRALEYVKHFVKAYEWAYENMDMPREHVDKYGYSIHRDEMDW